MIKNIFFKQKGPFLLSQIFDNKVFKFKKKIFNIKSLEEATSSDLTFLDSIKYSHLAKSTKGYEWVLIYKKLFLSKTKALKYEYQLKKNRKKRLSILKDYNESLS